MAGRATAARSGWRRFLRDDDGSFTIEAVIWLPVFVALLCMIADTALIFAKQSQAMRVVQDANRFYAVGRFADATATQNYILTNVRPISPNATVTSVLTNGVITTTLRMPARDLMATGVLPLLPATNILVVMQQMKEV